MRDVFTRAGFEVRLRLGSHPDEDVAFMTRARCLMPAAGGFAALVARLARERGATVLSPPGPVGDRL